MKNALLAILLLTLSVLTTPTVVRAQSVTVTAPGSVNNSPPSDTLTYSASVASTGPSVNSEQKIDSVSYSWSNGGSGSSTVVSYTASDPGTYSSSVSCTVTWDVEDDSTDPATHSYPSASGSASTTLNFGVSWTPGGFDGGTLSAPQDQSVSPASPLYVFSSPGGSLGCGVHDPKAYDTWSFGSQTGKDYSDSVTYAWSCSGGGFSAPDPATGQQSSTASGQSATWYAPATASQSSVSVTLTAAGATVSSPDSGSRGGQTLSASCDIYMPTLSVSGGSWSPNPGYVDEPISGTASAKLSGAPSSLTASCSWSTTSVYYSSDGTSYSQTALNGGGVVWSEGSLTSNFVVIFETPGYFIIGVSATVSLLNGLGNTLCTLSGNGYVGGAP